MACTLWCELAPPQDDYYDGSESDPDYLSPPPLKKKKKVSAIDEKNQRIEDIMQSIQAKHGDKFTKIQYRLWAEMVDVGTHKSLEEAPSVPMFGRKGGRQTQASALTHAITNMATSFVSAAMSAGNTTPTKSSSAGPSSSSSPVRVAQLRSQYIQQLKDLHALYEAGALNEQEYTEEKELVLGQLKSMTPRRH